MMSREPLWIIALLLVLAGCAPRPASPAPPTSPAATPTPSPSLPKAAAAYCRQNGGQFGLETSSTGEVTGFCVFSDGSRCEEWAFFLHACKPGQSLLTPTVELGSDGWKIYRNEALQYSFHYPADAEIQVNDETGNNVSILGPEQDGARWPQITISLPGNRDEYRLPPGTNLAWWLSSYNLFGDQRLADVQIAGSAAVHFRHAASAQTAAYDSYYFARGEKVYSVVIVHAGNKEDWGLYDHFLESIQFWSPPAGG